MSYTDGMTGESRESSFSNSVAHYFDENGYLCNDIFDAEVLKLQNSLATEKKNKWIVFQCSVQFYVVIWVIICMSVYYQYFVRILNVRILNIKLLLKLIELLSEHLQF